MPKPRRTTRDEWIDTFSDWDAASQEAALDLAQCVHRQTRRAESRKPQPAASAATAAQPRLPDESQEDLK